MASFFLTLIDGKIENRDTLKFGCVQQFCEIQIFFNPPDRSQWWKRKWRMRRRVQQGWNPKWRWPQVHWRCKSGGRDGDWSWRATAKMLRMTLKTIARIRPDVWKPLPAMIWWLLSGRLPSHWSACNCNRGQIISIVSAFTFGQNPLLWSWSSTDLLILCLRENTTHDWSISYGIGNTN